MEEDIISFYMQWLAIIISQIELSKVNEALEDDSWIKAMQKKVDQFQKNDIWKLVRLPNGKYLALKLK